MKRLGLGLLVWNVTATAASACPFAPDRVMVEKYYADARAKAALVVVGRLKASSRYRGVLTAEKVINGKRRRSYIVVSQSLLCTYSIPSIERAVFYLGAVPHGYGLLATSAVK